MRRTLLVIGLLATAACGGDPRAAVTAAPVEDRLAQAEARRICELQANAFADLADADRFVDGILAELDVTRAELEAFRDELREDEDRAAEVSDRVVALCG